MVRLIGRDIDLYKVLLLFLKKPNASFHQFFQKIREMSLLDYRSSKKGYSLPPSIITYEITHNCNLRCKTCWFYGNSGLYSKNTNPPESLDIGQIKKLIDNISSFKPYFLITGGEPLLYPHLKEVLYYADKKRLFFGLITNGILINEEKAQWIIDSGLNFITVSIDGPNKLNNEIRGNPNAFDKAINGIALLKKHRKNKKFPIITINVTISKYNFDKIKEMVKIAEDAGVDILQFQHQWFSDNKTAKQYHLWAKNNLNLESNFIGGFENYSSLGIEVNKLKEQIEKIKSKKVFLRVFPELTNNELNKYYASMDPVYTWRCVNPWFGTLIRPNGNVDPCIDYTFGNIKEESFKEIWNNEKARFFRKKVKQIKYFPGCTRCCGFFRKCERKHCLQ
ncbi:MAG: radical SAM protein [Candidatus Woesearchaeota archaeon]